MDFNKKNVSVFTGFCSIEKHPGEKQKDNARLVSYILNFSNKLNSHLITKTILGIEDIILSCKFIFKPDDRNYGWSIIFF